MATAGALQARVHKLLGSRAELEATKALLRTLVADEASSGTSLVQLDASAGPETPTLATLRRNLRSSLEQQQLALAQTALAGLERTLEQVSTLAEQVDALDNKCDRVHQFLETTKRETQQVQAEAAALAAKRFGHDSKFRIWDKVQGEWKQARAFLDRYQLTEDEVRALYAEQLADEDMEASFSTLERVQQVKADCKELVAAGDVSCGLELLDAVGRYQEAGFERLYQWTAKKCAEVDGEPSNMLHRAIALLSDRAEFYNYCKECLTASRRSLIVRRFIMALTVGGPNGIPRPIEMHAHDPVRYCGDMLAWIHQSIATESEFFRVLFDGDVEFNPSESSPSESSPTDANLSTPGNSSLPAEKVADDAVEEVCTSMVGRAFDGVARPLQVRVEQTLSSPHGIVIAYKLVHLLAFYHHKFDQLVAHADVARALRHCRDAANGAFHRQFKQLVDAVAASAQDYAASLAATHVVLDVSHRLVALLEVFQTSLLPEQEKEAGLAPLFDGVLPAVELMCQRSVAGLDPVDALVFRINNFSCLQAPLARFPEVAKWHTGMSRDVDRWLRDLSELQATRVMDRCRVSELLQRIQQFQQSHAAVAREPGTSPADTPGLDGETVTRVMGDFCAALMTLLFPQLDSLAQPALGDKTRALTSATLAGTYAFIHEFVFDARNGYIPGNEPVSSSSSSSRSPAERSRRVVLQHTPEEIRTVLEIDGDTK
ncbi:Golgi transport complex subunit 6 [Phytophthora pseudosyringae]|uniref:Conserved oligomeric Golgi complex subunit 6 n=1 Tax=Phytophthora pseudosyringae TaxID=221518 RepID=A0A8T1VH25_9STRA|nr:Golgi transport complex subunit 6 [Phytophthora pseudosyringae]